MSDGGAAARRVPAAFTDLRSAPETGTRRIRHEHPEIKKLFDDYLEQKPDMSAMDAMQMTDDVIFYQAAETLDGNLTTAVGTLVFRDGLVWRQTVSFVGHRPS